MTEDNSENTKNTAPEEEQTEVEKAAESGGDNDKKEYGADALSVDGKRAESETDGVKAGAGERVEENLGIAADTAEAEENSAAAAAHDFGSDSALTAGYSRPNSFTRQDGRDQAPFATISAADVPDKVRREIISDYLKSLFNSKSVPLVAEGVPSPAPKSATRSIREAGALVNKFLKN